MKNYRVGQILKYFEKSVPEHLKYGCFEDTMSLIGDESLSVQWLEENDSENFKQVHRELLRVGQMEYNTWSGMEYLDKVIPEEFKGSLYQKLINDVCETPFENRNFSNQSYLTQVKDVLV